MAGQDQQHRVELDRISCTGLNMTRNPFFPFVCMTLASLVAHGVGLAAPKKRCEPRLTASARICVSAPNVPDSTAWPLLGLLLPGKPLIQHKITPDEATPRPLDPNTLEQELTRSGLIIELLPADDKEARASIDRSAQVLEEMGLEEYAISYVLKERCTLVIISGPEVKAILRLHVDDPSTTWNKCAYEAGGILHDKAGAVLNDVAPQGEGMRI